MLLAVARATLDLNEENGIAHTDYEYLRDKIFVANCQSKAGNKEKALQMLEECLETVQSNPSLHYSIGVEFEVLQYLAIINIATGKDKEEGMKYFGKAQKIANQLGIDNDSRYNESMSHLSTMASDDLNDTSARTARKVLQVSIASFGKNHHTTIVQSLNLARELFMEDRLTEALVTAKSGLQSANTILGASHPTTVEFEGFVSKLENMLKDKHKNFAVDLITNDASTNGKTARVLRQAKDDESKYIVMYYDCFRGSRGNPKKVKASIDQLRLCEKLPVTCHGLLNAAHLNGKAGRIKSYQEKANRYEICFDDESIKGCLVRPENLRINI